MRPTPTGTDDALKSSVSLRPHGCSRHIGLGLFGVLATVAWAQGQGLLVSDPHDIVANDQAAFIQRLDEARPAPVTPEAKAMVLKSLPPEGEIATLNASAKGKVTALHPVLRATQRAGVYEIKVIDIRQAAVAIHGRAVILISKPALEILETDQLRALGHDPSAAALRYFASVPGGDFDGFLRQRRPARLAAALRAEVISSLPRQGELRPTARDAAKLDRIQPVLTFHGQQNDLDIRLVDTGGSAAIVLYARTVIVISREALDRLEPDELQAMVAHEVGHLYFSDEYDAALRRHGNSQLQELELRCDGISVVTLHRLGVSPDRLESAVTRLTLFNERRGRQAAPNYVTLPERLRFIRAVAAVVAERASPRVQEPRSRR